LEYPCSPGEILHRHLELRQLAPVTNAHRLDHMREDKEGYAKPMTT
jgi:hypothetical protein